MRTRVALLALVLLSGAALPVRAEAPSAPVTRLTLEQCQARARAHSHQLAGERHRLAALEAQVEQAFWAPFSGFTVKGFLTAVPDKCVDETILETEGRIVGCSGSNAGLADDDYSTTAWGPMAKVEVEAGIPLYTFGKISNAREAIGEVAAAKRIEIQAREGRIAGQVIEAFQAILGAREMLFTIGEGRKHLVKAREKVEADLAAEQGTATEIDLIKLKVFESEVDALEAQTRQIERTALAALRALVGAEPGERIDIPEDPQEISPGRPASLETYKTAAVDHRPELAALRHAVRALEAKVELRHSQFFPDLLLTGGFRYAWTPGRTRLDNWAFKDDYNFGPAFGVGLALRYELDLGLDIYRLDEAKAELAALTSDQQAALDGVLLEVEKSWIEATAAADGLAALERSRKLVKGWIAATMQGHAAGVTSAKEVQDALKEYFQVMANIYKLTHDYNVSLEAVRRAAGLDEPPPAETRADE